jgi:hypothetical protein
MKGETKPVFHTFPIERGDCDLNPNSHVDRDVVPVLDPQSGERFRFCEKCYLAQLRLRSRGRKAEGNGEVPAAVPAH